MPGQVPWFSGVVDPWAQMQIQPLLFAPLAKHIQEYAENHLREPRQGLNAIANVVVHFSTTKKDKNALTKMLRSLGASAAMERHFTQYSAKEYTAKLTSLLDTFAASHRKSEQDCSSAIFYDIGECEPEIDRFILPDASTRPAVFAAEHGPSPFTDMADTIAELQSRVAVLERVFVFVDWEQLAAPCVSAPEVPSS